MGGVVMDLLTAAVEWAWTVWSWPPDRPLPWRVVV